MLRSAFSLKDEVLDQLDEGDRNYILLEIYDDQQSPRIKRQNTRDDLPVHPRHSVLKEQLDTCCRRYGIERKGLLPGRESRFVEFSKQVQQIFYNEVLNLLRGFDIALKRDKKHSIDSFRTEVLKASEATRTKGAGKRSELEFIKDLLECQSVACLYDEAVQEKQGNYARVQAMEVAGKSPPIELLRITLYSTPAIVLSRLNRMVEASMTPATEQKQEEKKADSEIPLREKFDWGREITKMKVTSAIIERSGELRALRISRLKGHRRVRSRDTSTGLMRSSDSSGSSFCTPKRSERDLGDIVLNMEEVKVTNPYYCSVIRGADYGTEKKSPKSPAGRSRRKGTRFYGRKGVLAFLKQFMSNDKKKIKVYGVADEERAILEYLKNSLAKTQSSSGAGIRESRKELQDDDNDSVHSEGGSGSGSTPKPVEMVSVLVDSLIDKFSHSFINRDPQFMYFSSSSCLQFHLYLAFFYSRLGTEPLNAFKVPFSF